MNKTQVALVLAAGIVFGAGGRTLVIPGEAIAIPNRFQNTHVWVARIATSDAGIRTPIYGGHQCADVLGVDGGTVNSACVDLNELTPTEATAFEAFLASVGVAPPR